MDSTTVNPDQYSFLVPLIAGWVLALISSLFLYLIQQLRSRSRRKAEAESHLAAIMSDLEYSKTLLSQVKVIARNNEICSFRLQTLDKMHILGLVSSIEDGASLVPRLSEIHTVFDHINHKLDLLETEMTMNPAKSTIFSIIDRSNTLKQVVSLAEDAMKKIDSVLKR